MIDRIIALGFIRWPSINKIDDDEVITYIFTIYKSSESRMAAVQTIPSHSGADDAAASRSILLPIWESSKHPRRLCDVAKGCLATDFWVGNWISIFGKLSLVVVNNSCGRLLVIALCHTLGYEQLRSCTLLSFITLPFCISQREDAYLPTAIHLLRSSVRIWTQGSSQEPVLYAPGILGSQHPQDSGGLWAAVVVTRTVPVGIAMDLIFLILANRVIAYIRFSKGYITMRRWEAQCKGYFPLSLWSKRGQSKQETVWRMVSL